MPPGEKMVHLRTLIDHEVFVIEIIHTKTEHEARFHAISTDFRNLG